MNRSPPDNSHQYTPCDMRTMWDPGALGSPHVPSSDQKGAPGL